MDAPNPMETIRSSQLRQFTNSLRHGENGRSSLISARYFSVVAERIEWSGTAFIVVGEGEESGSTSFDSLEKEL